MYQDLQCLVVFLASFTLLYWVWGEGTISTPAAAVMMSAVTLMLSVCYTVGWGEDDENPGPTDWRE